MNQTLRSTLPALGFAFAVAASAHAAATAKLEVTKPLAAGTVTVTFTANGVEQSASATVSATDSAEKKCEKLETALKAKGFTVNGTCPNLEISNLPNGTTAKFDPGKTGEGKDQITMAAADGTGTPSASASIGFRGSFNGVGGDRKRATFTAGVITDGGSVEVTYTTPGGVSMVPGFEVAEQLHAMLAAAVAEAGLDMFLFLDGDTILVEYGPGAGKERGVSFGTTATNRGAVGTVN